MKRFIALVFCVIPLLTLVLPVSAAEAETEEKIELEIDVNRRYTDISDMDEGNEIYFEDSFADAKIKESNKMIYIAILCVLLVVAIIVLVVSLRRVPKEDDPEERKEDKNPSKKKSALELEEKPE